MLQVRVVSWRASWVLTSDGTAHLPTMQGPGLLLTGCRRSLPSWVPQYGPMQGQRRCRGGVVVRGMRRAVVDLGRESRPQPFLDRLTGTVELAAARSVLWAVITLADEAPGISNEELRSRLHMLAQRAERRS